MDKKLFDLYNAVFNENGDIKACGRNACIALIVMCEKVSGKAGDFGDAETGFMNVNAIKSFVSSTREKKVDPMSVIMR